MHPGRAGPVVCTDENVVFHLVSTPDASVKPGSLVNRRVTRFRDKDPTKLYSGRQVCILSIEKDDPVITATLRMHRLPYEGVPKVVGPKRRPR